MLAHWVLLVLIFISYMATFFWWTFFFHHFFFFLFLSLFFPLLNCVCVQSQILCLFCCIVFIIVVIIIITSLELRWVPLGSSVHVCGNGPGGVLHRQHSPWCLGSVLMAPVFVVKWVLLKPFPPGRGPTVTWLLSPRPLSSHLASRQVTFSKDQASLCSSRSPHSPLCFTKCDPRISPNQFPWILTQEGTVGVAPQPCSPAWGPCSVGFLHPLQPQLCGPGASWGPVRPWLASPPVEMTFHLLVFVVI